MAVLHLHRDRSKRTDEPIPMMVFYFIFEPSAKRSHRHDRRLFRARNNLVWRSFTPHVLRAQSDGADLLKMSTFVNCKYDNNVRANIRRINMLQHIIAVLRGTKSQITNFERVFYKLNRFAFHRMGPENRPAITLRECEKNKRQRRRRNLDNRFKTKTQKRVREREMDF